jgi:hypothetical protein
MSDLLRRQAAIDKTIGKYNGRPIDFVDVDCIRMLRSHLVAMGHKGLPKLPRYSSPAGALRALRKSGHESLERLLDSILPRIAPAMMLPGDVALTLADDVLDAATICIGHKIWGWSFHNDLREPVMIIPSAIKAAYRA